MLTMEEAGDIKQSINNKDKDTVNFENLHANMVVDSSNVSDIVEDANEIENKQTFVDKDENIEQEELKKNLDSEQENTQKNVSYSDMNEASDEDVATIAQEIIKNVVDNATEQIASEKNNYEEKEKKEEWLDILGNGSLRKKILKSGNGVQTRPKREEEVTIKYEVKLEDDTSVEADDNLVFVLGLQDVIDAIDLSVALMELGEKSLVESDAQYGYGADGKLPKIPPNAKLFFEIELLKVQDGPFSSSIDIERRISWADKKRQRGNMLYSEKKYSEATKTYTKCTKAMEKGWMCEESQEGRTRINELRLKCYNNLTASQMKEEKWSEALKSCRAAEKLEPNNVKALFRKGKIHVTLGELGKGVEALSKAAKLEPDNKTVAAEVSKHKRKLEKQKESQKEMYRRMLGTSSPDSQKAQPPVQSWAQNWGRLVGGSIAIGAVLIGVYLAQRN